MRHATWLLVACLPFAACGDDTEPGSVVVEEGARVLFLARG